MRSHEDLIREIAAGNQHSFKILYEAYKTQTFNTALGLVQNRQEAEEITQDVFIEVYKHAAGFKFQSSVGTWLYRMTINRSLDALRHRKRSKRFAFFISLFKQDSLEINAEKPDFIHPGVIIENKEKSAFLFKAIDQLPENQKTAFVLSQVELLPQKEISVIMNMSEKAVESLLQRAKTNLRSKLEKFYPERRKS